MIKIKDKIVLAILTGTIAAAIANAFGYFTKWLYPKTVVMPEVAAELFVKAQHIHNFLGIVFGNLLSFIVGGLYATALIFILDLTGWRFIWWKSLAVASTGFLIGVGLLFKALNIAYWSRNYVLSPILFYGAHLVYLTIAAFIVGRYGVPNETEEEKKATNAAAGRYLAIAPAQKKLLGDLNKAKDDINLIREQVEKIDNRKSKRKLSLSIRKK